MTERERDDRAPYRPYRVEVARVERMTPHFVRVVFRGDDLDAFGTDGLDQRIKLLFPAASGWPDLGLDDEETLRSGDWYDRIRGIPHEDRPAMRTFTVRAVRPDDREIDVDFVDHGPTGRAGAWLAEAEVKSQLVIVGPTSLSVHSASGIDWRPGSARRVLLAGDETAAPAICAIVESLGDEVEARAFVEIPHAVDVLDLSRRSDDVTWLMRGDAPVGQELGDAVRGWFSQHRGELGAAASGTSSPSSADDADDDDELLWESPESAHGDFYAWIAGEAGAVTGIRRHLVTEVGVDRAQIAFMGYWKIGRAESQG